jgi:hypothetical protein
MVAVEQENPLHIVPPATCWQAPPAHRPVLPQGGLTGQRPCGSASGVTVPSDVQSPGVRPLHVLQVPQLAKLQQTPSTQLPVVHWWPDPQLAPAPPFGWQDPFGPSQ